MKTIQIPTRTHGRLLIEDEAGGSTSRLLVGFHGYAQRADELLDELRRIPGASRFRLAAVQALHRFYSRGDEHVVASWMTRQDRELMIADNVGYVDLAIDALLEGAVLQSLFLVGFSQGAAMAYRAGMLGRHPPTGIIAVGGDIPPELKDADRPYPAIFIGAGDKDSWYTPSKLDADLRLLASREISARVVHYRGGHVWTEEIRNAIGEWLLGQSALQVGDSLDGGPDRAP